MHKKAMKKDPEHVSYLLSASALSLIELPKLSDRARVAGAGPRVALFYHGPIALSPET